MTRQTYGTKTCTATVDAVMLTASMSADIGRLLDAIDTGDRLMIQHYGRVVRSEIGDPVILLGVTCPGIDVEVDIEAGDGFDRWQCPVCGTDHEEEA